MSNEQRFIFDQEVVDAVRDWKAHELETLGIYVRIRQSLGKYFLLTWFFTPVVSVFSAAGAHALDLLLFVAAMFVVFIAPELLAFTGIWGDDIIPTYNNEQLLMGAIVGMLFLVVLSISHIRQFNAIRLNDAQEYVRFKHKDPDLKFPHIEDEYGSLNESLTQHEWIYKIASVAMILIMAYVAYPSWAVVKWSDGNTSIVHDPAHLFIPDKQDRKSFIVSDVEMCNNFQNVTTREDIDIPSNLCQQVKRGNLLKFRDVYVRKFSIVIGGTDED